LDSRGRDAHAQNAFLVASDPMARSGFYADASNSLGIRQDLGKVGLTLTSESGKVWREGIKQTLGEPRYSIGSVTADRKTAISAQTPSSGRTGATSPP
jgi:hypothetical protein